MDGKSIYGGSRVTKNNIGISDSKPFVTPSTSGGAGTPIFQNDLNKNGLYTQTNSNSKLLLVADDAGATWSSRVGSVSATRVGVVQTRESPFYPNGGFLGSGYRVGLSSFNPTGYYTIPYNSNIEFNNTDQTTWFFIIRTGALTRDEVIFSKHTGAGYNCRLKVYTTGNIEFVVGYDGGNAVATLAALNKNTYYLICCQHDPATKTAYINYNGVTTASGVGVGNIYTDNTTRYRIGGDDNDAVPYMLQTHLLEIWKENATLMSITDLQKRVRYFSGFVQQVGSDPFLEYRFDYANVFVNNKLWRVGRGINVINQYGALFETPAINQISNSTFVNPLATGWVAAVAGGSTITLVTNSNTFSDVGGQTSQIFTDLISSLATLSQTTVNACGGGFNIKLSVDYNVDNPACVSYWQAYNVTTGNYYNSGTNLWQAGAVYNVMGSSLSRTKFTASFNNDAVGSAIQFNFSNNANPGNANNSIYIHHIQCEFGSLVFHERIVSETAPQGSVEQILIYPAAILNGTNGRFKADITMLNNGSSPTIDPRSIIGSFGAYIGFSSSSGNPRLEDGAANTVQLSTGYTDHQLFDLDARWKNATSMSITSSVLGSSSLLSYTPVGMGFVGVGQTGNIGQYMLNGYIKNIKIY
jgi:hypothetical protein